MFGLGFVLIGFVLVGGFTEWLVVGGDSGHAISHPQIIIMRELRHYNPAAFRTIG